MDFQTVQETLRICAEVLNVSDAIERKIYITQFSQTNKSGFSKIIRDEGLMSFKPATAGYPT